VVYSGPMKLLYGIFLIGLAVCASASAENSTQTVETIVCIRHGEKPPAGLGQLTCRGLNRALALPKVLLGKYGAPQFVFAPNPTLKADKGKNYNYVRPLMTIEPTAIRCGLPVNTEFSYQEIPGLEKKLEMPEYQSATIFVAWEHDLLDQFVKDLVKTHGGDSAQVPKWPGEDYDSIFLVKITRSGGTQTVSFTIDHEGLDNVSDDCP
jgi:hypothetical protein